MDVYKKNYVIFFLCTCLMVISLTNAERNFLEIGRPTRPGRFRPPYPGNSNKTSKATLMCEQYKKQACSSKSSGKFPSSSTKIVGGNEAESLEFPHMAALGYPRGLNGWHHCGASLISDNFLMTAAHCVESKYPPTHVRLGDLNLESPQDDKPVIVEKILEVHIHPDYNSIDFSNDIALIKIRKLSQFTEYIRPICLNELENIPSQKLSVSGWGRIKENGPTSSNLRAVEVDLLNYSDCKLDKYKDKIMICAGYLSGEKDSCNGDSGGPLQISTNSQSECSVPIYKQVGIVSWGKGCARRNSPGVYTRISNYISWIENIVWK